MQTNICTNSFCGSKPKSKISMHFSETWQVIKNSMIFPNPGDLLSCDLPALQSFCAANPVPAISLLQDDFLHFSAIPGTALAGSVTDWFSPKVAAELRTGRPAASESLNYLAHPPAPSPRESPAPAGPLPLPPASTVPGAGAGSSSPTTPFSLL